MEKTTSLLLEQYYLGCLAHASYLVGDAQSGEVFIIDPQRDIEAYTTVIEEQNLKPQGIILTHFHADFIAGHIELRDHYDIPIYLGDAAKAEYDFKALKDRDVLLAGSIELTILTTPGHTPEGISILVNEQDKKTEAVLTGDTLFIGDVGRPDLLASVGYTQEELGNMLYKSLREKLLTLDDDVKVYPAHGAGSLCGKNLSKETVSTIGEQRQHNYALQDMSPEEFLTIVTADQTEAPQYFLHDAIMNKQDRAILPDIIKNSHKKLDAADLFNQKMSEKFKTDNNILIDVRPHDSFAHEHFLGSINIGIQGSYATWAGSIIAPDTNIYLIAEADHAEEAITRLGRIGYDSVQGVYHWDEVRTLLDENSRGSNPQIHGNELVEFLTTKNTIILDVRNPSEYAHGHFPEALNIPLGKLNYADLDPAKAYLVHCAGGYRSSAAMSILEKRGFSQLTELAGGFREEYLSLK